MSRIAIASATVSLLELPNPSITPPLFALPGVIVIMFVPAPRIWASITAWAPEPSATIVMTAPTPMIMPSMVRAVRSLLRPRALSAIRKIINSDTRVALPSDRRL